MMLHREDIPTAWEDEVALRVERERVRKRPAPPRGKSATTPDKDRSLPRLVLVERCAYHAPAVWFFVGVHADGIGEPLLHTRHEKIAREEVERYARLGIPLEVYKPWR